MNKNHAWADLLQESINKRAISPTGKGWIEGGALKKEMGLGKSIFYDFLKEAIASGQIEAFDAREPNQSGRLVRRTYYRRIK